MVRKIITDETMELEVGFRPVVVSPNTERKLNTEAKVLLILSPVNKDDIAMNYEMELDAYDVEHLIEELQLYSEILEEQNKIK